MSTCINLNLPYFQNLISTYGEISAKEILANISRNDFKKWYGNSDDFPKIDNQHIITNFEGNTVDVRDFIFFSKNAYAEHLNSVTNNVSIMDTLFNKQFQNRLIISNASLNLNGQQQINNIIKDSIENIKLKPTKTFDEQKLIDGSISIENYFGLNKQYKYLPDNKYDTQDELFEVYHKLKLYAEPKYLPLINYLIKNSSNNKIIFEKVTTEKKNNKLIKITDNKFSALYKPISDNNTSIIYINEYQLKKDNYIKGSLKYDDIVTRLIIHELLHDYTNYRFYIDDNFKEKFDNILKHIRDNLSNEELKNLDYILSDSRELITYLLSDDSFKSILMSIPSNTQNDVYHEYLHVIKKSIDVKDKSIIDDILSEGLNTIQLKPLYNSDFNNIQSLKREVKSMYRHISDDTLIPILESIEKDWFVSKLNNLNFNLFKNELLNRLKNCL